MRKLSLLIISFLFLLGCNQKEIESEGVVTSVKWYSSSVGFSRMGARGYFKQKVGYSYWVGDSLYHSEFDNGKRLGALSVGDSLLISFKSGNPTSSSVIGRKKKLRPKHPTAKGSANEK